MSLSQSYPFPPPLWSPIFMNIKLIESGLICNVIAKSWVASLCVMDLRFRAAIGVPEDHRASASAGGWLSAENQGGPKPTLLILKTVHLGFSLVHQVLLLHWVRRAEIMATLSLQVVSSAPFPAQQVKRVYGRAGINSIASICLYW